MHSTVLGPALNKFYKENRVKAKKLEADLLGIAGRSGIEGLRKDWFKKGCHTRVITPLTSCSKRLLLSSCLPSQPIQT